MGLFVGLGTARNSLQAPVWMLLNSKRLAWLSITHNLSLFIRQLQKTLASIYRA
jgi:hypothetical protein